ncbi:Alpha/Beta hydrolase protein [Melanogaster broomeanus]|nr:Alpha/Beta hydrolase protein [Melanogaster broomeanus]
MSILQYTGPSPFYKELAEVPLPISADFVQLSSTATVIRVTYAIRDHERKTKRSVTKTFTLSRPELAEDGFEPILTSTAAQDASDIQAFAVSPSKKYQAILREVADANSKKRFVEIWTDLQVVASLDVTKLHGQFHTDDVFKSLAFSPSETALIYTAEANPDTEGDIQDDPYPNLQFKPDFGESLFNRQRPTLFMLRWRSPVDKSSIARVAKKEMSLTALTLPQSLSDTIVLGQAVFATEERIFTTGYEKTLDGRFLGIKWCSNRPASIWELMLPAVDPTTESSLGTSSVCTAVKIEVPGRSSRSPRVLYGMDGKAKQLFWLSHPVGGPHMACSSLHVRDLVGGTEDRVLVHGISGCEGDQFPGLYTDFNLLANPFIYNMTPSVVLQTCWRSSATIVSVQVETGDISHERMWFGGSPSEGWTVLVTDGVSRMVCSKSSLTSPPKLVLLTLNRGREWIRTVLDRSIVSPEMEEALGDLAMSVIPIPDRHPTETIVLKPKKAAAAAGPRPYCVTIPHGGPHSVYTTSFAPAVTALALEGYTISMPNFTGSVGFGDKCVHKLLGHIGTLDIGDCIAAVEELIKLGISESGRQLVQGVSHVIGQYPDVFKAAVMQNPVTSLGEFASSSDIPDFPFVEMGVPYAPGTCVPVTPDVYKTLYEASPIAHVDSVRTPVLVIIGEGDRRVPPTQGKNYFHALKGRGREVEMLTFPGEEHAFEGVEACRIGYEAMRDWFGIHARD